MDKIVKKNILAIEPIYIKDKGNSTRIYTKKSGHLEIHKTVRTFINNLAKYYHLDIKEAKKTYGELLSLKKFPPIPFTYRDIFISIKTRKPKFIHDGAYGYVKLDEIHKLVENNKETIIHLKNGDIIKSLSSKSTLKKRINNGKIVKQLYRNKKSPIIKENQDYYINKNERVTKEDIALLYMKISEMKKIIEE